MAELDSSGYTFTSQPTKEETEKFEYVGFDYFGENPGYVGGEFTSYTGIYFADDGATNNTALPEPGTLVLEPTPEDIIIPFNPVGPPVYKRPNYSFGGTFIIDNGYPEYTYRLSSNSIVFGTTTDGTFANSGNTLITYESDPDNTPFRGLVNFAPYVYTPSRKFKKYSLTSPYNLNTLQPFEQEYATATQQWEIDGNGTQNNLVRIKPDGTKIYLYGNGLSTKNTANTNGVFSFSALSIHEMDLLTPFDLNTIKYVGRFNISLPSTVTGSIPDFRFSDDGEKLFVMNGRGNEIREYILNEPWTSQAGTRFNCILSVPKNQGLTSRFIFDSSGTKLYVGSSITTITKNTLYSSVTSNLILEFSLVEPYSLQKASLTKYFDKSTSEFYYNKFIGFLPNQNPIWPNLARRSSTDYQGNTIFQYNGVDGIDGFVNFEKPMTHIFANVISYNSNLVISPASVSEFGAGEYTPGGIYHFRVCGELRGRNKFDSQYYPVIDIKDFDATDEVWIDIFGLYFAFEGPQIISANCNVNLIINYAFGLSGITSTSANFIQTNGNEVYLVRSKTDSASFVPAGGSLSKVDFSPSSAPELVVTSTYSNTNPLILTAGQSYNLNLFNVSGGFGDFLADTQSIHWTVTPTLPSGLLRYTDLSIRGRPSAKALTDYRFTFTDMASTKANVNVAIQVV
jgi:hypothetical protein